MKAVLISIRPKWCEKIANRQKAVEVRKTRPKLETPFKCYIYCTLPPQSELFTHGGISEYANELIRLQSGEIVYDYGMRLCCDYENRPYTTDNFLCQKVIGEFVCDKVYELAPLNHGPEDTEMQSCLSREEIVNYLKGKGFGWHISDLMIYDKSKELGEFKTLDTVKIKSCQYRQRVFQNPDYLDNGGLIYGGVYCKSKEDWCCNCHKKSLKRPPQSWCYVEVLT